MLTLVSDDEAGDIDWDEMLSQAVFVDMNLRATWAREVQDLIPWVIDKFPDLGGMLGFHLQLVRREAPIGSFRVDILARDEAGRKIVVEIQFGPTDHKHFGQVVLYALEGRADVVIWVSAGNPLLTGTGPFRREHVDALIGLNRRFAGEVEFYGVGLTMESEPGGTVTKPCFAIAAEPPPVVTGGGSN
jgi:hypothetical protein